METCNAITKPLLFQADRGALSQDAYYVDRGYRFILAPNRYRKLAGSTPYTLSESALIATQLEQALRTNPDITNIGTLYQAAKYLKIAEPVASSGIRLFALTSDELYEIQTRAHAMMKSDWPQYADYVVGYEPHINMHDEILIWRNNN